LIKRDNWEVSFCGADRMHGDLTHAER